MYERRTDKLLSRTAFIQRVFKHVLVSIGLVASALSVGILGYHFTEGLSWLDSLLNASMILGGMGPVSILTHSAAKWFASFYALFCGVLCLGIASILVAPFAHRLIHHFHLKEI